MSIEQDMRDVLVADGAVSALVSDRVYVGHIFSDLVFPAIQIRATGGDLATNLIGENGIENRTFQIDAYATGESDAANIARVARTALTGLQTNSSVSPNTQFNGIGIGAPVALYEDEHSVHRLTFEMSFWF